MKVAKNILLSSALVAFASATLSAQTYTDSFTMANTIDGGEDIGPNWAVTGGLFINGNEVAVQADNGIASFNLGTLSSEGFTLSADFKGLNANLQSGLLFNYDAIAKTGLVIRITEANASAGLQLLSYDNGAIALLDQNNISDLTTGTYYTLEIKSAATAYDYDFQVTTIGGTAGDLGTGTLTDSGSTVISGLSGLYSGGTYMRMDNFSLTVIPEPSSFAFFVGALCLGVSGMRRRNVRK